MENGELEILVDEVKTLLDPWLNKSGGIFYSGRSTVTEGDFYLMGLNPGGDPIQVKDTISESLSAWQTKSRPEDWSEYWHESWLKNKEAKGEAPHQVRVIDFCKNLLRQDVCTIFSANILFVRTSKEADLPRKGSEEYVTLP